MNTKLFTAKPYIDEATCEDVLKVLRSGLIAQGPKVSELESKFAEYCNVKYCAALNSGTAALHAGLYALGITKDDEVITTPFTFVATINTILMLGSKPVFVDIDENSFNLDPKKIQVNISNKTKAIIPVHLYGLLAQMDEILEVSKKNGIKILEDACQAHGASLNDKKAGSFGDIGAFSFYATKNIMTAEGGIVTSDNEDYIEKVKSFRHHGMALKSQYNYTGFGYNYRMTDIHAVIGLNQLKKITEFNDKRQANAKIYDEELCNVKGVIIPKATPEYKHVYHQYTIRVIEEEYGHSRDELVKELQKNDIFPGIFYPKPLHLYPTFKEFGYKEGDFPVAEKVSGQVLSLPVHPQIGSDDIMRVVKVIQKFSLQ